MPEITLSRVAGYRRSHGGRDNAPFIRSTHTLRIRQIHGLGFSTVRSISPLRPIEDYGSALINFHVVSRAAGPKRQIRT